MSRVACILSLLLVATGCHRPKGESNTPAAPDQRNAPTRRQPECTSLTGQPLYAAPPGDKHRAEQALTEARTRWAESPGDVERLIWVGRRLGYLWRMNEAIAIYTDGLRSHPAHPALLRHRGHRKISIRRFGDARTDLELAAQQIAHSPDQIEPDGQPNARNIPLTTLAFNVHYHRALACYLLGDLPAAEMAWRNTQRVCGAFADNHVAVAYWLYLTLRRLDRHVDAERALAGIDPTSEMIENHAYHRLCQLYQGRLTASDIERDIVARPADAPALLYGLGEWHALHDDSSAAHSAWRRAVDTTPWPAFGHIASEVALMRTRTR